MSDSVQQYVEVCHCGHSKHAHFELKHTCLGMLCECKQYADRDDPLPKPPTRLQPQSFNDVDDWADTQRVPITHPMGCTCSVCAFNFGVP